MEILRVRSIVSKKKKKGGKSRPTEDWSKNGKQRHSYRPDWSWKKNKTEKLQIGQGYQAPRGTDPSGLLQGEVFRQDRRSRDSTEYMRESSAHQRRKKGSQADRRDYDATVNITNPWAKTDLKERAMKKTLHGQETSTRETVRKKKDYNTPSGGWQERWRRPASGPKPPKKRWSSVCVHHAACQPYRAL